MVHKHVYWDVLLIPFLNITWNNLSSRKEKQVLLLSLCFCTTMTTMFNAFDWIAPGFLLTPSISNSYNALLSDWWVNIYPIFYYFIGAYLKEYPVKIGLRLNIFLIGVCVLIFGGFNYYR